MGTKETLEFVTANFRIDLNQPSPENGLAKLKEAEHETEASV